MELAIKFELVSELAAPGSGTKIGGFTINSHMKFYLVKFYKVLFLAILMSKLAFLIRKYLDM